MVVAGQPMDASSTDQLLAGIRIPREFVAKATAAMTPGTTMLVTPTTATGETGTAPGFTVIASEKEPGPQEKKKG
jgi:hypothetical protein